MRPLRIGLCFDLKEDYLAAGFSPEQVMELDEEETVAGLAAAIAANGHEVERIGRGACSEPPRAPASSSL